MKSFKQYITELASPYETNPLIKKALKKYDDPVKFLLNMMHLVPKLPRMGKKNTLELVKVWNDNKSKKINAALVEQVLLERPAKITINTGGFRKNIEEIRGLINPTLSELTGFIKNTPLGVRFLVHPNEDLYVWDAAKFIHNDVTRGESLAADYIKGSITYDKYSKPNVYAVMSIQGGKKYAKKMAKKHPVFKELLALPKLKVALYK